MFNKIVDRVRQVLGDCLQDGGTLHFYLYGLSILVFVLEQELGLLGGLFVSKGAYPVVAKFFYEILQSMSQRPKLSLHPLLHILDRMIQFDVAQDQDIAGDLRVDLDHLFIGLQLELGLAHDDFLDIAFVKSFQEWMCSDNLQKECHVYSKVF